MDNYHFNGRKGTFYGISTEEWNERIGTACESGVEKRKGKGNGKRSACVKKLG